MIKSGNDTTITYTFLKEDLTLLRAYIVKLEGISELYEEDKKIIILKDSIIDILNRIIVNKETMLSVSDSTIRKLDTELIITSNWAREQERLRNKYERKSKNWPRWLVVGVSIGVASCLLFK